MKHSIPQERLDELRAMAHGLYNDITNLAKNPFEAVTIITMIHLLLWMNNRKEGFSTETMLEDYCHNFLLNYRSNEETLQ